MQYFAGLFYQTLPQACVVDLTPPTFAGIQSLTVTPAGALRAQWLPATDPSSPIQYDIYVQIGTAVGLFSLSNRQVVSAGGTQLDFFPNGAAANPGANYFVGVRARDAIGNIDGNTASLSIIYTLPGVLTTANIPDIVAAVWNALTSAYAVPSTFGKKVGDLALKEEITQQVWREPRASHNIVGAFGEALDAKVSERATQVSLDTYAGQIKGTGFAAGDSLKEIRDKINQLPTSAGDATLANQVSILAAIASKAEQSLLLTVQSQVLARPTNPLLTTDSRLNNLDATISSRALESTLTSIKGAGFNPSTDSLEQIRDAVAASVDLTPVLNKLTGIEGAGFDTAQHSLKKIKDNVDTAISSANTAASQASTAAATAATRSSQSSVDSLAAAVALIPTNPLATNDSRLNFLDAAISSRLPTSSFNQILGGTFNPSTDNLEEIRNAISAINAGDAQQSTLLALASYVTSLASQASVNSAISSIASIPTNPLLTTDVRLNNLNASIASRAAQSDIDLIKGVGFNSSTDSLHVIAAGLVATVDLTPVLQVLAEMKGVGFVSVSDSLKDANDTAKQERGSIKADTSALLSSGIGV